MRSRSPSPDSATAATNIRPPLPDLPDPDSGRDFTLVTADSPTLPRSQPAPIRRKPLPFNDSRLSIRLVPSADAPAAAGSAASPVSSPASAAEAFPLRNPNKVPRGQEPLLPSPSFDSLALKHSGTEPTNASLRESTSSSGFANEPIDSIRHQSVTDCDNVGEHQGSVTMSSHAPLQPPRPMARPPPLRVDSDSRKLSAGSNEYKQQPKTPGSKITSFFGWNSTASPGAESTSTEISDSGLSPLPSPMNGVPIPPGSGPNGSSRDSSGPGSKAPSRSQTTPPEDTATTKVAEVENELREISSELAGSIRREMELEDMIERLQMETNLAPDANRRTSDYFSDSGNGSVKYPLSDAGSGKAEDLEKAKRNFEQQRAQLKVELSQKWQEERSRRQAAESHVQILEDQVSQFRREKVDASNIASRAKEFETSLEDTRRRLAEERELKDNYEDLLTAMRVDLEQNRNEKDQIEERMQSEIRALRNENATLSQSRKPHFDGQQQKRINSIAEEGDDPTSAHSGGLSRSSSLARMPPNRTGLSRSGSLSRPTSMIVKGREFGESLADTVKDTEMQRDALHRTVKSLLERQAYEARQNEKRVKVLELELERARQSGSPRERGYGGEVTHLREEISSLRRRADDTLQQKWQCEKGLAGLKMDLDRAEQETSSLRALLEEHDTPVPEHGTGTQDEFKDFQATASSLETAYKELQAETRDEIHANETLANEVRQRVAMNGSLKDRLSKAIGRGEREQQLSVTKINEMQVRLKHLEEKLMLAQQHSEEEVAKHEQEVNALKESHNAQLLRARTGERSPGMLSPILPNSPFSGARSPRLSRTTTGEGMALNQAVQTHHLETKVKGLEKALRDADMEMGEVVSRMNKAQIEVAELQSDRDEALRETRRLQAEIHAERQKFRPVN